MEISEKFGAKEMLVMESLSWFAAWPMDLDARVRIPLAIIVGGLHS